MEPLRKDTVCSGIVEGYSSEGLGVVRVNGAVVFVPQAVRGETIDFRITRVMKTAAVGEIVRIQRPSPERAVPDCPYYGTCGGCDFRHLSYPEELWAKRQRVQDALRRLGGSDVLVEEIIGAKNPEGYRNKCQYPVGPDGSVGFFRARSHQVVPVKNCLLQPDAVNRTANAVGRWMKQYKIPAYNEKTGKGLIRHIYVRVNHLGQSLCCLVVNGKGVPREPELAAVILNAAPKTLGVLLNFNTSPGNVILGKSFRTVWGQDFLMDQLCGLSFRLSAPSFYQVNREQAEVLYGKALEFAGLSGTETVLDLYCGAGTITLCMAGQAKRVVGAEIVPSAVRDARENARRNHIHNAEFFLGDASEIAARFAEQGLRPDVITVDPPRKGLAPEVIQAAVSMLPRRIVYVSCDPATLGRDLSRFAALDFFARRAVAVDMFPGTRHVETIVCLSQ